ncbi:MAG: hypothetical protein HY290_00950 [Planctomycetia bacterium]|nr:hypothetical protein [Planctomycetia bacterium]
MNWAERTETGSLASPAISRRGLRPGSAFLVRTAFAVVVALLAVVANPAAARADKFGLFSSRCSSPGWKLAQVAASGADQHDLTSMRRKAAELSNDRETYSVGIISNDGYRVVRPPPENPRCQTKDRVRREAVSQNPEVHRITRTYFSVFYLEDGNWVAEEKYPCRDTASDRVQDYRNLGKAATFTSTTYYWMSNDPKGLTVVGGVVKPSNGNSTGWRCIDSSN